MEKIRYSVSGKNVFAKIAAFLLALSVLFRLVGYWGFWNDQTPTFCYVQILMPVIGCILFIVILLYLGNKAFTLSVIPVVLGVVYFIVRSMDFGSVWQTILCVAVCLLTVIVYTSTVFGSISTKWVLLPVFGLTVLYQILVKDRALLFPKEGSVSIEELVSELSVICIMLAMLFIVFAMKKRSPEKLESVEGETVVDEFEPEDLEKPKELEAKPVEIEAKSEEKPGEDNSDTKSKLWDKFFSGEDKKSESDKTTSVEDK